FAMKDAFLEFVLTAGIALGRFRLKVAEILSGMEEAWSNFGLLLGDMLRVVVGLFTGNTDMIAEGLSRFSGRAQEIVSGLRAGVLSVVSDLWGRTVGRFTSGVSEALG